MRRLLLAALLMVTCAVQTAQAQCAWTFSLHNDLGSSVLDGWEDLFGGQIYVRVYQYDNLIASVTLASGDTGAQSVNLNMWGESAVVLVLDGADLFSSFWFEVDTAGGVLTSYLSDYSDGDTIAVVNHPCPDCSAPINLTISYPSSNGFTLNWSPSSTPYTYHIYLNGVYYAETINTSYSFNSLNSGTNYTVGVRKICNDFDSSALASISSMTACGPLTTLPYMMDFENEPLGTLESFYFGVACWERLTNATAEPYLFVENMSNGINHTLDGTKGLFWYRHSSPNLYGSYHCLVLPPVDLDSFALSDLSLHFWAHSHLPGMSTNAPTLYVGVLTDPTDITTFTYVDTITVVNDDEEWRLYGTTPGVFANYSDTGNYIGIRSDYSGYTWYVFVDDVSITKGWCEMPENVTYWPDEGQITLSWEPNGGSTFTVFCGNDTVTNITDTFYTFTGLNSDTYYYCGVSNMCTDGPSFYTRIKCKTSCTAISELPYTENFESVMESGNLLSLNQELGLSCWRRISDATEYINPAVGFSSTQNHTANGEKGLVWSYMETLNNLYGKNTCLVLPPIDTSVYAMSDLQVHFWAKHNYLSTYLILGVMTNPTDISTFDSVDIIYIDSNWWTYTGGTLVNYSGNGKYIALRAPATSFLQVTLDDISVTAGWCPMPQNPVTYVDPNNVTIAWEPNGGTTFTVKLGLTTVSNITDTFYTFTDLTPNTQYLYSITNQCDTSMSVATVGKTRTSCLPTSLPWSEDFESAQIGDGTAFDFLPCWSHLTDALVGTNPYVAGNNYYPAAYNHTPGGSKSMYWSHSNNNGGNSNGGTYHCMVLPEIDAEVYSVSSMELQFWAKIQSVYGISATATLIVGVVEDPYDINTFDTITTITLNNTSWEEIHVLLNNYDGGGTYVAIRDGGGFWNILIDDVKLNLIPLCPPIKNMKLEALTAGSAYVSWEYQPGIADPGSYYVCCAPVGDPADSLVLTVEEAKVALTGLLPNTKYCIKVHGNCDNEPGMNDSLFFETKDYLCLTIDTSQIFSQSIGHTTYTTSELPIDGNLHSITQQVYLGTEIEQSVTLTSLEFKIFENWTPNVPAQIYLGHTNSSALTEIEHPDDMTLVWDDTTDFVLDEWYEFVFDVPFNYNPLKGNLLVTCVFNGGFYGSNLFQGDDCTNSSVSYNSLSSNIDPYTVTGGDIVYFRNAIKLNGGACGQMGTCVSPAMTVDYVSEDTVVVSWIPGLNENYWNLWYRELGDTVWIAVDSDITEMQHVFVGLNPNSEYEFKVSTWCDSMDYEGRATARTGCGLLKGLPWSEDFESVPVYGAMGLTNFIPCWGLTAEGGTVDVGLSAGGENNHTTGGITSLSWKGWASVGNYETIVLPGFDVEMISIKDVALSFWAKNGDVGMVSEIVVGAMSDPENDSTFVAYDTITLTNTAWNQYKIRFNDFAAETSGYVAIRGYHPYDWQWLYIDDIIMDEIPSCEPVEDVNVTAGVTSAIVGWEGNGDNYTGAMVAYRAAADTGGWDTLFVMGETDVVLGSLESGTLYEVQIRAVCGEDTNLSTEESKMFCTKNFGCVQYDEELAHLDTVGNLSTNISTAYVVCGDSYYGYSQELFGSNELGGSGYITSITIKAYGISEPNRHMEIYMAHTATNNLSDFEHPADFGMVYDGITNFNENQWYTFTLDEPFYYNGYENLLVAFRDVTGVCSNNYFAVHTKDSGAVFLSGITMVDPNTPAPGNGFSYRTNTIFDIKPCSVTSQCAAPATMVTGVGANTVDVAWVPGNNESAWNTYYRLTSADTWTPAAMNVTDTFYTFTDLQMGHSYVFRIESVCSEPYASIVSASTECALISELPFAEDFDVWVDGTNVVPNCWTRAGMAGSVYIISEYNHSVLSSNYNGEGGSFQLYSSADNSIFTEIMLPALDTTVYKANETQLRFYGYRLSSNYMSSYPPLYIIGVQDDKNDASTFTPVDTVYHTGNYATWQGFSVPLTSYTGSGAYVTIRMQHPTLHITSAIDDVVLELTPSCANVDSLISMGSTTSSVSLGWAGADDASAWEVSYGPIGFEPEIGTVVTAYENPFTLLPNLNSGQFYVRPLCDNGDTGHWNTVPGSFFLIPTAATIPYNYDFESSIEWNNWQGITNDPSRSWVRGTAVADSGSYSMYVSGDNGTYYKPYYFNSIANIAAFRDINFGEADSSYTLSFRARAGGTYDNTFVYDGLKVYVVDTGITPVASNGTGVTPWGDVSSLTPLVTVSLDTVWKSYQTSIDNISGVRRLVFFWYNESTVGMTTLKEPAAIDNIHLDYSSCPRPLGVTATEITPHTATISWQESDGATYQLLYCKALGTNYTSIVTDTNSVTLTGLDSINRYWMWVRKYCNNGDTSLWTDKYEFMTPLCFNSTVAYNYDTTQTDTSSCYAPIGYGGAGNCYMQMLIDSAYMSALGDDVVSAFAFNPLNMQGGSYYTCIHMWMANIPETDLSSGWITSNNTDHIFEKVLNNATFNFNSIGWQIHPLDSPFTWDGHSNVLITILRNHNNNTQLYPTFAAHTTTTIKTLINYRNGTPYTLDQPGIGCWQYYMTGDIMLLGCNAPLECNEPTNHYASDINYQGATVNWTSNANSFEVKYKNAASSNWSSPVIVSDTSYQITGLADSTKYLYCIRGVCLDDVSGYSVYTDWVQGYFYTLHKPCLTPTSPTHAMETYNSFKLNWNEMGGANKWNIHVWNDQYDHTYTATTHPYTVIGLQPNNDYYVSVRAKCSTTEESEYGDTIIVSTAICQTVSDLTVNSLTSTTATITWNNSASAYDIEYGDLHFDEGVGTTVVHVTSNNYTISGLEPEHNYSVSCRAMCENGIYSPYCAQVDFSTLATGEGIDTVGNASVSILPNPTSEAATIAISGITGPIEISLVDLSGRVVRSETMHCEDNCTKRFVVTDLVQGAYLVRLKGEQVIVIKKLIVK